MEAVKLERYFRVERSTFIDENFYSRRNSLYLTESGMYEYKVDGQSYRAAELDCVVYKKGSFYDRRVLAPVVLHIFDIDRPVIESLAPVSFTDRQRIRSDITLLNAADRKDLPYIAHLLNDILYLHQRERLQQEQPVPEDQRIVQALELIRTQFDKEVSVSQIATAVHLSYPQFNRLFVKQMKLPPVQYINQLRVDKAKVLLRTTDLPVKAVAAECGFRDIYYFSNFFKTATGIAPTQYRTGKR